MQGIQAMHISQAMLNARLLQATEVLRCSMLVLILVQQLLQVSHLPLEVWPGEAALHDGAQTLCGDQGESAVVFHILISSDATCYITCKITRLKDVISQSHQAVRGTIFGATPASTSVDMS